MFYLHLKNLSNFIQCQRGHVGVMFGIMLIPIFAAVGMSIDYTSAVSAKTKIQVALDAAALAAGRKLQTSGSVSEAEAAAQKHFDNSIGSLTASLTVDGIDPKTGKINLTGNSDIPTMFMSILGIDSINVRSTTEVELKVGDEEKDVEISMMLDVTGSMGGSKIADLKLAAKDLVQIIMQSNESSPMQARIALVPFSESVNVSKYAQEVANSASSKDKSWKVAKDCVSERTGVEAFTDASPKGTDKIGPVYTSNGKCQPTSELMPLSDDQSALEKAIDDFKATGYTAGHIGTAWAWYTLSPNWKTVWPKDSRPDDYSSSRKFAVLMTDGEYNTEYENGIMTRHVSGSSSPNGTSDEQADKLCENMKTAGITVYTIGFALNSGKAKSTMKECATSEEHYFEAADGDKLREAFREIAFQIAKLRITK